MACFNSPFGPLTVIVLSVPTVTVIPLGMTTGFFPILDISRNLNNYNSKIFSLQLPYFHSSILSYFDSLEVLCFSKRDKVPRRPHSVLLHLYRSLHLLM